jgi:hypothetical protein
MLLKSVCQSRLSYPSPWTKTKLDERAVHAISGFRAKLQSTFQSSRANITTFGGFDTCQATEISETRISRTMATLRFTIPSAVVQHRQVQKIGKQEVAIKKRTALFLFRSTECASGGGGKEEKHYREEIKIHMVGRILMG